MVAQAVPPSMPSLRILQRLSGNWFYLFYSAGGELSKAGSEHADERRKMLEKKKGFGFEDLFWIVILLVIPGLAEWVLGRGGGDLAIMVMVFLGWLMFRAAGRKRDDR